ncbi:bifunctional hydroxymethylpyrimidine kinase/phosphomethylpyrimidine kinase [Pectinatus sottacetonis]|uniref:bifunctional hydroxymethylpyrimidine kinase/phosphomethylpyrimidine kinase n=1 Tax=Pectinatus sottacetonis TaxID=1002795 RepID=UPI0018C4C956|nr:bifunctional hydroxymethylpyrimidine kinase/phosphomethylpyrimidine kinase [Pectinatus sottacetonis]
MSENFKALTIAGSDTSGSAGMEADLKTFEEMKVYGMTALTVIVAQNPQTWSHDIFPIELSTIEKQIDTIGGSITPDAMKTGMLGSAALVELVVNSIEKYKFKNIVIDPVMVCKGIDTIMVPEAAAAIKTKLVKYADVITPNTLEAAYLADIPSIKTIDDIKTACVKIHELGAKNIIIKSGSRFASDDMSDVLFDGHDFLIEQKPKLSNIYNSGAGCSFSAAITACLAKGATIHDAFKTTQAFMQEAVVNSFKLNKFTGAVCHWALRK